MAQTTLLVAFAAVELFVREPLLFSSSLAQSVGLGLCALGLLLIGTAFFALRGVIQIAPEPKAGGHLVSSGIYRWLRHPIYTAILAVVVGLFLRRPTLALAVAGIVVIVFLLAKTRYEEHLLANRYPEYTEYRRRTWGIIPGLR